MVKAGRARRALLVALALLSTLGSYAQVASALRFSLNSTDASHSPPPTPASARLTDATKGIENLQHLTASGTEVTLSGNESPRQGPISWDIISKKWDGHNLKESSDNGQGFTEGLKRRVMHTTVTNTHFHAGNLEERYEVHSPMVNTDGLRRSVFLSFEKETHRTSRRLSSSGERRQNPGWKYSSKERLATETSTNERRQDIRRMSLSEERQLGARRIHSTEERYLDTRRLSVLKERLSDARRISSPEERKVDTRRMSSTEERRLDTRRISSPEERRVDTRRMSSTEERHLDTRRISSPEERRVDTRRMSASEERRLDTRRIPSPEERRVDTRRMSHSEERHTDTRKLTTLEQKLTDTRWKMTLHENHLLSSGVHPDQSVIYEEFGKRVLEGEVPEQTRFTSKHSDFMDFKESSLFVFADESVTYTKEERGVGDVLLTGLWTGLAAFALYNTHHNPASRLAAF